MADGTFADAAEARRHAAMIGHDFDNQCDYCEPCRAYHVGIDHDEAVPDQCGATSIAGFNAVNDCRRPAGHDGPHCDINGTSWTDR